VNYRVLALAIIVAATLPGCGVFRSAEEAASTAVSATIAYRQLDAMEDLILAQPMPEAALLDVKVNIAGLKAIREYVEGQVRNPSVASAELLLQGRSMLNQAREYLDTIEALVQPSVDAWPETARARLRLFRSDLRTVGAAVERALDEGDASYAYQRALIWLQLAVRADSAL
jgi:hypothetical protein